MELCLEINSKLQALLEDTLIKNITLKVSLSLSLSMSLFKIVIVFNLRII
jgi:hypothetical protein